MTTEAFDLCTTDDGRIAACKCYCCQQSLCRICFNEHTDNIDHNLDNLIIVSKIIKDDLNNYLTQIKIECDIASENLNKWYKLEQKKLEKSREEKENALKSYFQCREKEFLNEKQNHFHSRIEIISNKLQQAIQTKSATKLTVNLLEQEFKSISSIIQHELFHPLRQQSQEISNKEPETMPIQCNTSSTKQIKSSTQRRRQWKGSGDKLVKSQQQKKPSNTSADLSTFVPLPPAVSTNNPSSEIRLNSPAPLQSRGELFSPKPISQQPPNNSTPSPLLTITSLSPNSSSVKSTSSKTVRALLPNHDYTSFILTNDNEISILYKISENDPTYAIQTITNDTSFYGKFGKQIRLELENIQGFCWVESNQSYAFISTDAVYLYNRETFTQIHREPMTNGVGQAIACNDSYILCKTATALHFFGTDLKTGHNEWNDKSMELERFHTIDIHKTVVALCGRNLCRLYKMTEGIRSIPVLIMEMAHGGSSISINYVSNSLKTMQFLLANHTQDKLEIYQNDKFSKSIDIIKPVKCLSLKKQTKSVEHILILSDLPNRIEEMTVL